MKVYKMILISLFVLILTMGCINAYDLNDDDIQNDFDNSVIVENNINEDISSNGLDLNSASLDSNSTISHIKYSSLSSYSDYDSNLELSEDVENKINQSMSKLRLSEELAGQTSSSIVHMVSQSNYSKYFDINGNVLTNIVSPGDTIDLSGKIVSKNFIFSMPCHITSSTNAQLTNCMIKFENLSSSQRSSVSNLHIKNSVEWCSGVYILNSTNVDVFGNDIYSTGANGNPVRVIYSNHSNIFGNRLETNFTGYMNLSWKRAGILLGDSHYNNIYSNNVTIKDSNPIYLTTYGFEKSNYNVIFNNTVNSSAISEESGLSNPSAWAYGIHLMGDYNLALNNTIHNVYRGIDSEGSFNILAGNIIFNLTGGYFEGNDGTEGGDYGIHASYDNILANNTIFDSKLTGSAIYLMPNNTAYGNIVYNISGKSGIELNYYADNCNISNNIIDVPIANPIYVFGRMNNLTIESNVLSSNNASSIVVKKQSNSKYPTNVSIYGNLIMNYLRTFNNLPIDFTQVPDDANIVSYNNSIAIYNDTFFSYYDENALLKNPSLWEGLNNILNTSTNSYNYDLLVYCGKFADLGFDLLSVSSDIVPLKSFIAGKIYTNYREIPFGQYHSLIDDLKRIYLLDTVFENIYFELNSSGLSIDSLNFTFSDAYKDGFIIVSRNSDGIACNNLKNISFTNNDFYFKSSNPECSLILANNISDLIFNNNNIVLDGSNYAMVINCSNSSLSNNIIKVNAYHSAILVSNQSNVVLDDNIIDTLSHVPIDCENASYPKFSVYVVDDTNYDSFFNADGTFKDDISIEFGNTLKLGNLTNKKLLIDIPLKVISLGNEYSLINTFISFEGEGSNSVLSNVSFEVIDFSSSDRLVNVVTIKDGVSNLTIVNNSFNISGIDSSDKSDLIANDKIFSVIRLIGSDYLSKSIYMLNNKFNLRSYSDVLYGVYISNKDVFYSSKVSPRDIKINNNEFDIKNNNLTKAIYLDSVENSLIKDNLIKISSYTNNSITINSYTNDSFKISSHTNDSIRINSSIDNSNYLNSAYALDLINLNNLNLSNNQIFIANPSLAYGLALKNSNASNLEGNKIFANATSSIGLGLYDDYDFNVSNNNLSVYGGNFASLEIDDYLGTSVGAIFIKNDIETNVIKNSILSLSNFSGNIIDNDLNENGVSISFLHSSNSTKDVQNLIDDAGLNGILYLGNSIFSNLSTINIDKNITINGGVFLSNSVWSPLFNLISDSNSNGSSNYEYYKSFNHFNILNGTYLLNDGDNLVSLIAYNGTGPLSIQVPKINISGNEFLGYDDSTVGQSISILKLSSVRSSLAPDNPISIENNTLLSGIKPFKFEIISIINGSNVFISPDSIIQRKSSQIAYKDMTTKAIQYLVDGRKGEYFNVTLKDGYGRILANKPIQIGFNGKVYNRTTDENGSAKLQINLAKCGTYTFAVSFRGDEDYNGSFVVAKITVKKQTPILKVNNVAYKTSAKTKTLTASLKTSFGTPIKNKKISFIINGKTYITSTNSKGLASLKVSLSTKKTYGFTVKVAGDSTYNAVTKTAKLTIK